MSESYREQHPLLYEEFSEEEYSPRYQRRFRPMVTKGRANNNIKGAAAIIKLWPEHWSSSVTYWWIALGMIGLVTIIVYNSVVVFSMLPPTTHFKEPRPRIDNTVKPLIDDTRFAFNIYMHLFADNKQEIDLNNYMPYIDVIANKYSDYKYHLIIVINDTSSKANDISAEENNEIALDLLWAKNSVHNYKKDNLVVEHVLLSKYLDESPLHHHWRKLPKQFIQFLTRAVSIWDKGGIAFNPLILTPRSPHAIYIEKVINVMKNINNSSKNYKIERKVVTKQHSGLKKRVNNIRDIINALEHEDEILYNIPPESSSYDDLKQKPQEKYNSNKTDIMSTARKPQTNITMDYEILHPKFSNVLKNKVPESVETLVMAESNVKNESVKFVNLKNTTEMGILPMFLEFLFRNKPQYMEESTTVRDERTPITRKRKHALDTKSSIDQLSEPIDHDKYEKVKPLIVSTETRHDSERNMESIKERLDVGNQFTIDLKGNIVSSAIPCHAFLGTMFSNAIHHTKESLTDFIITELSFFCKGTLSSCKGIDVILL